MRFRLRHMVRYGGMALFLVLTINFLVQGLYGKDGYFAIKYHLQPRVQHMMYTNSGLVMQKKRLKNKAALLRHAIDPDLLDYYKWVSLGHLPKGAKLWIPPKPASSDTP